MESKSVYDNYEISPCTRTDDAGLPDPNGTAIETCDDADAQFWTLYGHIEGEGVEAIGDFNSREAAEEVYYRITGQPFTGSYQANARLRLMHAAPRLLAALWAAIPFVEQWSEWVRACEDHGEKSDQIDRQLDRMMEACVEATGCSRRAIRAAMQIERTMQADWFRYDELDSSIVEPEFERTVPDGFNPVIGDAWSRLSDADKEKALQGIKWDGFGRHEIGAIIKNVLDGKPKERWFEDVRGTVAVAEAVEPTPEA